MNDKKDILEEAEIFVRSILQKDLPEGMVYHNLNHTLHVVEAAKVIGENSGLDEADMEVVLLAAWFHDIGYKDTFDGHESISSEIAFKFLKDSGFDEKKIKQVKSCIMATKMPQSPNNLVEKVLCDADLHHLGTKEYFEQATFLQEEINSITDRSISDPQWMKMNVKFLKGHSFFTEYANDTYEKLKKKNRKKVKKKLNKAKTVKVISKKDSLLEKKKIVNKHLKEKKPDRGVETMFRLTSKNHLELSSMADNKANIMISVNSIILSIILTVLIRKLDEYPHFLIPTAILTLVCLATIVFSILATRPNVSHGKFTRDNIINKETNLLFFGNFHSMKLPDYEWGMKQMMKDSEYLYTSLIRDIYFLGVVLGKKYKLLRVSYTIFMFGFVIAVVAFVIAEGFFRPEVPF